MLVAVSLKYLQESKVATKSASEEIAALRFLNTAAAQMTMLARAKSPFLLTPLNAEKYVHCNR